MRYIFAGTFALERGIFACQVQRRVVLGKTRAFVLDLLSPNRNLHGRNQG
jgi:hypothetical protein